MPVRMPIVSYDASSRNGYTGVDMSVGEIPTTPIRVMNTVDIFKTKKQAQYVANSLNAAYTIGKIHGIVGMTIVSMTNIIGRNENIVSGTLIRINSVEGLNECYEVQVLSTGRIDWVEVHELINAVTNKTGEAND